MTTTSAFIQSNFAEIGDDVYLKPIDSSLWTPAPWADDMITGEPVAGIATWEALVDTIVNYGVWLNSHTDTFTADAGTDTLTATAHGILVGTRVYFKGADLPAGITAGSTYYVFNPTANTFQLKVASDLSGAVVDITDAGTGTMSFTATSERASTDEQIGVVSASEVAIDGEGEGARIAAVMAALNTLIGSPTTSVAADIEVVRVLAAAIRAKTDLIGTASATLRSPASLAGTIDDVIYIGSDYLAVHGRAFEWTIAEIPGVTAGTSTFVFSGSHAQHPETYSWRVVGTVTLDGANFVLSADLPASATTGLIEGPYDWTGTLIDQDGKIITFIGNGVSCQQRADLRRHKA